MLLFSGTKVTLKEPFDYLEEEYVDLDWSDSSTLKSTTTKPVVANLKKEMNVKKSGEEGSGLGKKVISRDNNDDEDSEDNDDEDAREGSGYEHMHKLKAIIASGISKRKPSSENKFGKFYYNYYF